MGREARRAQARAERRQQRQRQGAPRASAPVSAPPAPHEAGRRGSLLKPRWVTDIMSELRKVTWPTRQETAHLTVVVIVVSLLVGLVLGGADLAFGWLVEQTILQ